MAIRVVGLTSSHLSRILTFNILKAVLCEGAILPIGVPSPTVQSLGVDRSGLGLPTTAR